MYILCTSPGDGQTSFQVSLTSVERRRQCSNEAKTRNPLKFVGVLRTRQPSLAQPIVDRSSPYYEDMWRRYCCLTICFPIVDTYLTSEDIAGRRCAMVRRWRIFGEFFASCIFSEPRAAHFRPAF